MPLSEINNNVMTVTCSPEWLDERMAEGEVLLLDCRSPNEYKDSHIEGAIHVAIPSLMLKRLEKGILSVASVINCNEGKEKFNELSKSETMVIYDDSTEDLISNPTSVVSLLVKRLQKDGCRVWLLRGGFSSFQESFGQHCVKLKEELSCHQTILGLRNLQIIDPEQDNEFEEITTPSNITAATFPVEVTPGLFLGNAQNSRDLECLYRIGIKYILNVTHDQPNIYEGSPDFKYMQIPIRDHWSQDLHEHFLQAISFIDEAKEQHCGVLVHCLAGISRSVTVTVAYLMYTLSLSLNDAYDYVKKCKPNISPNFNFMGQLLDFEKKLNVNTPCECVNEQCQCIKTFFTSPTSESAPSSSTSYDSEEPSPS